MFSYILSSANYILSLAFAIAGLISFICREPQYISLLWFIGCFLLGIEAILKEIKDLLEQKKE